MERGSFSLGPEMREMRVHLDGIKIGITEQKKANMHQETTNIHKNARLCKVIWVGSAQSQALPANSLLMWHRDDEHRPAQIEQTHNWRGTCESTPRDIQRISDSVEETL